MKKLLKVSVLGLTFLSATAFAEDKIGVVNISGVFQNMPQREVIAKELDKEFQPRADKLKKMEESLQAKLKKIQDEGAKMKEADQKALEKQILTDRDEFAKEAQAFEQDNQKRQNDERSKLLGKIQEAVKTVAEAEGYSLVVDSNAVTFAKEANDITQKVLEKVK